MSQLTSHAEIEDLGGGAFRQSIGLKRVAYSKNGVMTRITNALGSSGDPNLTVGVDELVQFRIRDKLAGQSPLMFFGKGASHVRMTPLNTNNVNGVVADNLITFPGAMNNADLRLTVAGHFVKSEWLLGSGHSSTFQWRIDDHAGFDPDTLTFGDDFHVQAPVLHGTDINQTVSLEWVVTQQGGKYILTCVLPSGDYAGWTLDPTLTLQPDATDGVDTRIPSYARSTWNYGIEVNLYGGETGGYTHRSLIKFNLTTVPDTFTTATLSLYCHADYSTNARTYRVYRQKRAWVEGTRNAALDVPATGATWERYDTVNNWSTAGGFHVNDCEQTDIGTRNFTATETLNEFKNFVLTPTTKVGLDLGNGWLVKADTESADCYGFYSSDWTTAANRPKLVVDYTTGGLGGPVYFTSTFPGVFG